MCDDGPHDLPVDNTPGKQAAHNLVIHGGKVLDDIAVENIGIDVRVEILVHFHCLYLTRPKSLFLKLAATALRAEKPEGIFPPEKQNSEDQKFTPPTALPTPLTR